MANYDIKNSFALHNHLLDHFPSIPRWQCVDQLDRPNAICCSARRKQMGNSCSWRMPPNHEHVQAWNSHDINGQLCTPSHIFVGPWIANQCEGGTTVVATYHFQGTNWISQHTRKTYFYSCSSKYFKKKRDRLVMRTKFDWQMKRNEMKHRKPSRYKRIHIFCFFFKYYFTFAKNFVFMFKLAVNK